MNIIKAKPGDESRIVVLSDGRTVRVYELVVGTTTVTARLQEVKPPLREQMLRLITQS